MNDKKLIRQDILNLYVRSGYEKFSQWVADNLSFIDSFNDRKLATEVVNELTERFN